MSAAREIALVRCCLSFLVHGRHTAACPRNVTRCARAREGFRSELVTEGGGMRYEPCPDCNEIHLGPAKAAPSAPSTSVEPAQLSLFAKEGS